MTGYKSVYNASWYADVNEAADRVELDRKQLQYMYIDSPSEYMCSIMNAKGKASKEVCWKMFFLHIFFSVNAIKLKHHKLEFNGILNMCHPAVCTMSKLCGQGGY